LIPIIVSQYTGPGSIGLIVAALYVGQLVSPMLGNLADKYNLYKTFYISGYVMLGLGLLGFVYAHNFANPVLYWFIFAFLQGAGAGTSNTISYSFVVEFHPKEEWDGRLGWLQTFYGAGQSMGLILASMIGHIPATGMLISAGLMIPGLILGRIALPDTGKKPHRGPGFKAKAHNVPAGGPGRSPASLLRHYEHMVPSKIKGMLSELKGKFGIFIVSWFLLMFGTWLIYNFYPLLMKSAFSINSNISSMYYAIAAVIGVFFYAPSGTLSQKFGSRKIVFIGILMTLVSIGAISILTFFASDVQSVLVPVFYIILPVAWSPLIVAGTAMAGDVSPLPQGATMGLFNATTALASVTAAVAGGFVARLLDYEALFYVGAVIVIISFFLYLPLLKKEKK